MSRWLRAVRSRLACAALALSATATLACVGVPSPLAPALGGSIGVPHHGRLTGAVPLPRTGDGYRVICHDGLHFGTPRLVGALSRAAAEVARLRPHGAPLSICDLSGPEGGKLARHVSHQTGRDADLLFYALTADGRPIEVQFVRFGPDGLAEPVPGTFVRLDVERQWLLVRSLVTDPDAAVQWMFIAHPIEALLIEYARARGEDPEILWRAEQVMIEPWDSLPHDDHLHLRLACTPEESIAGCLGGGPYWPWLPQPPQIEPMDDRELLLAIAGDLLSPLPGRLATK
ncbi:MAG: penicillin-insensitive murein endopeptidase [Polyangiaceae bacterium]